MLHENPTLGVCLVAAAVVLYNSLRNRHRLTRSAIVDPENSPWKNLLRNGDDASFLTLTGFSKRSFKKIVTILFFSDLNEQVRIAGRKRGRLFTSLMKPVSLVYICTT
jgi:hypothetical protein